VTEVDELMLDDDVLVDDEAVLDEEVALEVVFVREPDRVPNI